MSSVMPLPFAKVGGGLEVPTLRETGLDPDEYLLRLAATVRFNIADSLGLPASELGSVESWLGQVSRFGLLDYDEDDPEYCQEDKPSMESQEAVDNFPEVLSGNGLHRIDNILIPLRMPDQCQHRSGQESLGKPD